MGKQCPKVANRQWLSLGNVANGLSKNIIQLKKYFYKKKPVQAPDDSWYIFTHAFNAIIKYVNICFKSLQGKDNFLAEQKERLNTCVKELDALFSIEKFEYGLGILLDTASIEQKISTLGDRYITRCGALGFLEGLGSMVCDLFDKQVDAE